MKVLDNATLLDLKIDIQTDNDLYFQELAIFFDKPALLAFLPYLRKRFKINNRFTLDEYEEAYDSYEHENHFVDTKLKLDELRYSKIKMVKEFLYPFYDLLTARDKTMPELLEAECGLICYEFGRPPYFIEPIKQALFCGATNAFLFKPTTLAIVDHYLCSEWPSLPQLAIYVAPSTTYDDLEREFRSAREVMSKNEMFNYYKSRLDTAPKIRRSRQWYWQHIHGDTYEKIAFKWTKEHFDDETDKTTYVTVQKSNQNYVKLLNI